MPPPFPYRFKYCRLTLDLSVSKGSSYITYNFSVLTKEKNHCLSLHVKNGWKIYQYQRISVLFFKFICGVIRELSNSAIETTGVHVTTICIMQTRWMLVDAVNIGHT